MEKKFLTIEEAIDYFYSLGDSELPDSSDEEFDVCQLPPDEDDRVTDEENIDENDLGIVQPTDVCGEVSVIVASENIQEPSSQGSITHKDKKVQKKLQGAKKKKTNWTKRSDFDSSLVSNDIPNVGDKYPNLINLEPIELFFEYLSKEYISHLASMTTMYAAQHGTSLTVEWTDIAQFFGLLLFSGYHTVPSEDLYWSSAEDTAVPIVPSVMSRNRFRELKKHFHIMDNTTLNRNDKLAKIRPMYDELNSKFVKFGILHKQISIDESMVPYYGHHSCKMFIRGKPIRFGYKIWMMCSASGYPYKMDIYCGKSTNSPEEPLGTRVVKNLLTAVHDPLQVEVYFDNFFTSYDLLEKLREKNIKATGIVRDGRIAKCDLTDKKQMSKLNRGHFDYMSDGSVYICRWNDNSVVTMGSNHQTHLPLKTAKRYSREKKKKIDISQPYLINQYNAGMGGVDLLDKMLSSYRPRLRSKKWWWNLFSNALNMAVVAAWLLHKEVHHKSPLLMDHLTFRRQVTMALIRVAPRKTGPKTGPKVAVSKFLKKADRHFLKSTTEGRCAQCKKNTTLQCNECQKRMHSKCFPVYHGVV